MKTHPKLLQGSDNESGQILPLTAILITFVCIICFSLTRSLLKTHESLHGLEKEFQHSLTSALGDAYKLNRIARNNQHIADILQRLADLYLNGTAWALDLAATPPVWERRLPIPNPSNVYTYFDSALPEAQRALKALQAENNVLRQSLDSRFLGYLNPLSTEETLCQLRSHGAVLSGRKTARASCTLNVRGSFVALPQFKILRDLSSLSEKVGRSLGILAIDIEQELPIFVKPVSPRPSDVFDPFERHTLHLTHLRFCRTRAAHALKARCPHPKADGILLQFHGVVAGMSFEPYWSVVVHEDSKS